MSYTLDLGQLTIVYFYVYLALLCLLWYWFSKPGSMLPGIVLMLFFALSSSWLWMSLSRLSLMSPTLEDDQEAQELDFLTIVPSG